MNRILFAGGGTAGHIEPAWAVSQVWQARFPGDEIAFLGTKFGQEIEVIPSRGGKLFLIPKVTAPRKLTLSTLVFPFKILSAISQSIRIVGKFDVVVGFGGYVSASAYLAAKMLNKPVVLHDQNAKLGIANKLGSKFAKEVLLAYPQTAGINSSRMKNIKVVGNPLRTQIVEAARAAELDWAKARANAKSKLGITGPLVLILGGSSGSTSINEVIADSKFENCTVIHSVGKENVLPKATSNYRPVNYIEDIATALLASDLVITRSGAIATTEFAALGKYALFIPLPIGNGEQALNANELIMAHKGEVISQKEFTSSWLNSNLERLITQGSVAAYGTNLNSAELIADAIERAISGGAR
ncbi:MAG: UDP-N-acetylglucosamine--N-acetylmuramyl-(pentapeptide) pyrophosphoryl-undecaprenol N-acetylglucosamine transferase [Candidatus Nanopelagicaceae bacterium]